MSLRTLTSLLLLSLVLTAPAVRAQETKAAESSEDKTDLEKQMDKMGKAFRALRKQISDSSQNASSLDLIATIKDAAAASSNLTPKKAADLPEADRPAFVAQYQAGLKDLAASLDKVTADLKAGDNTAAANDLKDVGAVEGKNHKKFKKPEKE
jgi:soluble cytochrome b562